MAKGILRVKAKTAGDLTSVKMLAKHAMETGLRKDKKTGDKIPAKYLQEIQVSHAGKVVFQANLGTAISKNPYFSFSFAGGAKGEELQLSWKENTGNSATETAKIK
ncbi:thiosulfate oxidation carrier complex protein SoxZ [Marinobacterium jannaschii]|uniref:thiosulfate oxidation carrier complex protein SoxZ n=1 Tax=Marinobacterium jannaschii TaxID=64970 RepID=UPI0004881DA0|nr:thiosulfate oxidation carrier complex protein SoxZ [Marinobacterium jannaschii]